MRLRLARAAFAPLTALVVLLSAPDRAVLADGAVRLIKPEQYRSRIVAAKRGRVLVVNFWATWCEPCREEMPELVKASRKFASKDLAVILVSTDTAKAGPTEVPKFLARTKVPFVTYLAKSADPQLFIDAVDPAWDGSLPYTAIYDREGKLVTRLRGKQSGASFEAAIAAAVKAKR